MKYFIRIFFIVSVILAFSSEIYAAGYCPTPDEYTQAARKFANDAKNLYYSGGSAAESDSLVKSFEKYKKDTFYGCLNYFKTTAAPDCTKLKVLCSGYLDADDNNQLSAKSQINNILNNLDSRCPVDVLIMKSVMNKSGL